MLIIRQTNIFEKDVKRCQKRGYDMEKLKSVILTLAKPASLDSKYKDHQLVSSMYRDCHILPDWLLLYRYDGDILELYRTGTHSDLFR